MDGSAGCATLPATLLLLLLLCSGVCQVPASMEHSTLTAALGYGAVSRSILSTNCTRLERRHMLQGCWHYHYAIESYSSWRGKLLATLSAHDRTWSSVSTRAPAALTRSASSFLQAIAGR